MTRDLIQPICAVWRLCRRRGLLVLKQAETATGERRMYGCVRSMLSALLPLLLLALTMTYAAGQQAPQGGTASFYATGTDAPPVLTWEVLLSGTVVGSSSSSGGWSVAWNSPLFTVRAPKTAKVSSGYTVRYRPDYRSASFSVIAGATGGLNQPNGGTGGGCGGGGGGEAAGRSI